MEAPKEVQEFEVYGWVGRDELGSGEIGLKRGMVPAGMVPMVSDDQQKLDKYWGQAEAQAKAYGQRIYLVRFTVMEVIRGTAYGED